jgi:hypothetical protein
VKPVRVLGLVCALLTCARSSPAQQSVDLASIGGRVVDPSGAAVRGAEVTARHAATNVTAKTDTDTEGRFRFPYLRIGPYVVNVRHPGFRDAAQSLTLSAGAAFELPVSLELAGVDTDVVVTAETTVLEAARSQIAGTIPWHEVGNLPLNGRNFLDVALLVPGVSPTNVPATQMFPETSAVPGVGLSVSSQRNLSNNFVVDGLSANDDAAALSGITYGVDAIEQFQVVTSGGQAELGRALGGYVNIVTKSGTNAVHGSVYDYVRDDGLNSPNPLIDSTLPMSQSQFGGSIGGPLLKNRTFYFGNVEQKHLDQSGLVTISPTAVTAIDQRLDAVGYGGPRLGTGVFPIPVRSTNVLGKVDHRVGERDQLSVRYSLYRLDSGNSRNAGALTAVSGATGVDNFDQTFAIANTLMLSGRTVLETRAQIAASDFTAPPVDLVGPAVSIAGTASFGTSSGNPTGRRNTLYQVMNNLSHQSGSHALRLGVDFIYNDDRITYPRAFRGSYAFSSLANFLAGVYNNAGFTQTFGAFDVSQTNPNLALHAQDEWKLSSRITLNAGVRYDMQWLETIETDFNNLSPRVGVVWSPFAARHTIVRGNAGIFYDRVPLRAVANAQLSAANTTDVSQLRQIAISLSPAQASAPVFPAILSSSVPSGTLPNLTTMDRELQSAYSRQGSVEIEQQIGERGTISAGYHYLHGERLLLSINQNVPTCVASGNNNGCRPNSAYANNSQYSSAGSSVYHGLHVSLLHRPARWGQYRVSYTLSKAMSNVGEFFFSSPIDPFDVSKDWSRADNDQRHRLVVNGTLNTPTEAPRSALEYLTNGFQVSGMLQAYSALPLNITSGVTTIQGTAGRPVVDGEFIPRNAGVGSDFLSLNLRVSRVFHFGDRIQLEALGEVFNLTNHENVLTRNANFGAGAYPTNPSPTFGQVTAVGEMRSFQIGARLRF